MKYAILFSSHSGNTRTIAEAIHQALPNEECVAYENCEGQDIEADLIFVGSWTDKGSFDEAMLQRLQTMHHQKIALFGTAGFGGSTAYFDGILERVKASVPADTIVMDTFMCQGKMPLSVRNRYEAMLSQHPEDEKVPSFIANFDQALTHPDEQDIQRAKAFAIRVMQMVMMDTK